MEVGTRVFVKDGAGKEHIGNGTYQGTVDCYAVIMPDGTLLSQEFAEEPPEEIPAGGELMRLPGNPKILLDSGRVVYGCQVWWGPLPEEPAEAKVSPWEQFIAE